MKKISLFLTLLITSWFAVSEEPGNAFISDDVFIYMHTGPGTQFRILGSITAGAPISIIKSSDDGKYTQIRDNKDREGWVQAEFVSQQQSLRTLNPLLQQQVDATKQQITELEQRLEQLNAAAANWQQQKQQLSQQLKSAQIAEQEALASLTGEEERLKIEWMLKGGGLIVAGILFGIVLTFLPKRKRNHGGWA